MSKNDFELNGLTKVGYLMLMNARLALLLKKMWGWQKQAIST